MEDLDIEIDDLIVSMKSDVLKLFNEHDKYMYKKHRLEELGDKINIYISSRYDSNDPIKITEDIDIKEFLDYYKEKLNNKIENINIKIREKVNRIG